MKQITKDYTRAYRLKGNNIIDTANFQTQTLFTFNMYMLKEICVWSHNPKHYFTDLHNKTNTCTSYTEKGCSYHTLRNTDAVYLNGFIVVLFWIRACTYAKKCQRALDILGFGLYRFKEHFSARHLLGKIYWH